jgi:two-component system OmpR family response regulator
MGREPLTILVVDRDFELASSMTATLRSEGHEVHIAGTGVDSVEIARRLRVDGVLLDLVAPNGECFDVARQLRDSLLIPSAAIILLTSARSASFDHADAAGIDLVLTKPVAFDLLSGLIRQVQSARRRRVSPPRGGRRG